MPDTSDSHLIGLLLPDAIKYLAEKKIPQRIGSINDSVFGYTEHSGLDQNRRNLIVQNGIVVDVKRG